MLKDRETVIKNDLYALVQAGLLDSYACSKPNIIWKKAKKSQIIFIEKTPSLNQTYILFSLK